MHFVFPPSRKYRNRSSPRHSNYCPSHSRSLPSSLISPPNNTHRIIQFRNITMPASEAPTAANGSQTSLAKSNGISSPVLTHYSNFDIDTSEAERRLVWKCDLHILPVLFVMYTFAFLDRINIGNAKIQGLMKDLHMDGHQYNIALLIFFVPYIMLEVCTIVLTAIRTMCTYLPDQIPSNLILRRVSPSTWLSSLAFCWGIP